MNPKNALHQQEALPQTQNLPKGTGVSPYQSSRISIEDCHFCVVEGPHQGQILRLEQDLLHIGRADWCDLILDKDSWISKHHGEIRVGEDGIWLRDPGSRNGIYLGEQRIIEACLVPGAEVQMGETILALRSNQTRRELEVKFYDPSRRLVGKSPQMRKIFSFLPRLKAQDISLLLLGETGTGKSSIAQALHEQRDAHKRGPFVVVNCASLAPSLVEASL